MDYRIFYPYLNDHISFRLSDETVHLRNLKRLVPTIIELNGSALYFVREFTGEMSVDEIFTKVSLLFPEVDADLIRQDCFDILDRLIKEEVISLSDKATNKRRQGLEIVAPSIRSSIHFDITHKCNESCIHCLTDKDNAEAEKDDILRVLCQAAQLGFTSVSFSGGEPTTHPHIFEILYAAKDLGFYFTLFTNATHLVDRDIFRIASLHPESIRISLYSMNSAIHDHITQISGSFNATMRSIILFRKAGIRLFINIPITNQNYDGYRDVAIFCDSNGFERNLDPVVQPTRDLRKRHLNLQLNYEQAKDVTGFQQSASELVSNVKNGTTVCNAGSDPSIDANLNVYPCPGLRKTLGNLHKSTLQDIISNHPLIAELQSLDLSRLECCKQCEYLYGCYRCHGHGYQDKGSIYDCAWYDKRQARIRQELMTERRILTI
jgi:radical SAM protein with 4Fe4S-binding SPASM domain